MATPTSTTTKLKSASSKLLRSMSLGRKGRSKSKSTRASADRVTAFELDDVPLDGVLTKHKPKVVVAIDFGTTYSGYAYASIDKPDDIHLMRRSSGSHLGLQSYKLPTVLLLRENGDFHSFGYEARETYADMDETESLKYLYFEKFKMELHSRRNLDRELDLEAANGKKLLASIVFTHALRYFKDCCLVELRDQTTTPITTEDIHWVITVPAIWRQSAKQFMRYAATQAGLVTQYNPRALTIALEPEAAAIYCRQLQLSDSRPASLEASTKSSRSLSSLWSGFGGYSHSQPTDHQDAARSYIPEFEGAPRPPAQELNKGMRYVVADCGGGTVDLTVHEVEERGRLKELYKATGGAWGSMGVDFQFECLQKDIFGEDFINHFKLENPASWSELMSLFESKKQSFSPIKQSPTNISLPFIFVEKFEKHSKMTVQDALKQFDDENVTWSTQGTLRINPDTMHQLFEPVVSAIVHHIQNLLLIPQLEGIKYLFLVGGFNASPVLQKSIQDAFGDQLRIIIPPDVSTTILKGAVMFGLDPGLIYIRRSPLTYGVGCLNKFMSDRHPPEKKVVKNNVEWCTDVFDVFVYAGQAVSLGHSVTRSYALARSELKSTTITLFATESDTVMFVTDRGVTKVGELQLRMDGTEGGTRELRMSMTFGDTEITAEAMDCVSRLRVQASIDFLSK